MNPTGPWSSADFPEMSWHDVHVYAFSLEGFDPDRGHADLLLDIDYITNWSQEGAAFVFTVCRAELRFQQVFGLKLALDYATPSAGMCPFSLSEIRREEIAYPTGHTSFKWRLEVNWPDGLIEFEAPSFTQRLVGEPRQQRQQWLSPEHRARQTGA
jgi:hypothetical protein